MTPCPSGGDCYGAFYLFTSGGDNLDSDGTCQSFTLATNDLPNTDPQLGPLQDNGGPTETHALLPGSPAIDAAVNCADFEGNPITTDQRGVARPQGADCDIGAVETNAQVPAYTCVGFKPPFDEPLALKNKVKRAIPVKMELTDEDEYIVTDADIAAPPVINVVFAPKNGGDAIDYTDELLPNGSANESNIFAFNPDSNYWEYILGTKQFGAVGTYTVTVAPGDDSYAIETCEQTFERLP